MDGGDLDLSSWDLPPEVLQCYQEAGITRLFPWQAECLKLPGVLDGQNIVYSAPTSAGKTLVAEILLLNRLLQQRGRKALFVLPYISVAREKTIYLRKLMRLAGIKVEGFMGSSGSGGGLMSCDVAVCTIEKANALINRLVEEGKTDMIGSVVVDELHSVADSGRGYILELLLTKVKFCDQKNRSEFGDQNGTQIIGMSATLPNLEIVAKWLNAELYITNFRPVPLLEYLCQDKKLILNGTDNSSETNIDGKLLNSCSQDVLHALCLETVLNGCGTLIFCPTKVWCEKIAVNLAGTFDKILNDKSGDQTIRDKLHGQLEIAGCSTLTSELPDPADTILGQSVNFGVAYHHAGLTMEERDWVERNFIRGKLRVIVATSTLSSGVNLPAQRVIIRAPWGQPGRPGPYLTPGVYKQMTGRAGRKGIDTKGESILMCKPQEVKRGKELMQSEMDAVVSALDIKTHANEQLLKAVLEVIAGGLTKSVSDVETYLSLTFMATEEDVLQEDVSKVANDCVQYLKENSFVVVDDSGCISPSQLGSASIASSLGPQQATSVYSDLQQARKGVVLENELHMVFMVTPVYLQNSWNDLDWKHFLYLWARLSSGFRRVAEVVGVNEKFIVSKANQVVSCAAPKPGTIQYKQYNLHMRFYTAMALHELINENPLNNVATLFRCSRGFLQCLQQQASTFCGMVVAFCDRLGWHHLKTLLSGFAERLAFGVRGDLTDLVKVDGLDATRARCLHANGITSIAALATVTCNKLETVLRKAVPYSQNKCGVRNSWLAGHPDMSMQDAMDLLVSRAQACLTEDLTRLGINTNVQALVNNKPVVEDQDSSKKGTINTDQKEVILPQEKTQAENCDMVDGGPMPLARVQSDGVDSGYSGSANQSVNQSMNQSINQSINRSIIDNDANNTVDSLIFDMSNVSVSSPMGHKSLLFDDSAISENRAINALLSEQCSPAPSTHSVPNTPELFDDSKNESKSLDVHDSSSSSILGASPVLPSHAAHKRHRQSWSRAELNCHQSVATPSPVSKRVKENTPLSGHGSKSGHRSKRSPKVSLSPMTLQMLNNSGLWKTQMENEDHLASTQKRKLDTILETLRVLRANDETVVFVAFAVMDAPKFTNLRVARRIGDKFMETKVNKENPGTSPGIVLKNCKKTVVGLCIGSEASDVQYFTLSQTDLSKECSDKFKEILTELFREPVCCIHLHDSVLTAKSLLQAAGCGYKLDISGKADCFTTAAWVLNPDGGKLSVKEIIDKALLWKEASPLLRTTAQEWMKVAKTSCTSSLENKTKLLVQCCTFMKELYLGQLKAMPAVYNAYRTIELALVGPLTDMHMRGMPVDLRTCGGVKKLLHALLAGLEKSAEREAGVRFSIGRSKEVAQVLFVRLGLHPKGKLMDGCNKLSTSKEVLEKLTSLHPLPSIILQWRQVHNALTTVVSPILQYSTPGVGCKEGGGRQAVICAVSDPYTATGRITMHNPNLQTMQKVLELEGEKEPIQLRDLFVAPQGWQLVSVDYSQLELRVLAHLCADENLVRILSCPTGDVFKMIAAQCMQMDEGHVNDKDRHRAKQICYGLIYGMGVSSLAEQLGTNEAEAQSFIQSFHATFPCVNKWIIQCIDQARLNKYITTVAGRRRYLQFINANNKPSLKAQAERQAVNSTVQGSAADIFKTAMIKVHDQLKEVSDRAHLVMQLHDEVLLVVKDSAVQQTAAMVKDCMQNSFKCIVPMRVKVLTGQKWGSLTNFTV